MAHYMTVLNVNANAGRVLTDANDKGEDEVTPLHHAARYRREKKKKDACADEACSDVDEVIFVLVRCEVFFVFPIVYLGDSTVCGAQV